MSTRPYQQATQCDEHIARSLASGAFARQLLDTVCSDFGPRVCGSAAHRDSREYLAALLQSFGASEVHEEPVDVLTWSAGSSSVEVHDGAAPRLIASIQHVHSAAAVAEGRLVDAGDGYPEELERLGAAVEGTILLMVGADSSRQNGYLPLWLRLPDACRRGAAGALILGTYPDSGPEISFSEINRTLPVPICGISREDGLSLRQVAQLDDVRVRMTTEGRSVPGRCANLVADFGPEHAEEEMIVLSAHLDCHHNSLGALDNLTGVATVIELCRALAPCQEEFQRTLRVVLFTGEEYGFLGSLAYVRSHEDELDRVRLNFNMDCLFPQTAQGVAVMWSPEMRPVIERALQDAQQTVEVRDFFCMSSDYLSFMMAGVPAARPADFSNSFPEGRMHTASDTPERIPTEWVQNNAQVYSRLLARLLFDPHPLPTVRRSQEEVAALILAENVAPVMQRLALV